MKFVISLMLSVFAFSASAMNAETIEPKTKVIRPVAWYSEQADLWKNKVQNNPKEASGWINYFTASRYAQLSFVELNNIVLKADAAIPNTFEVKIIKAIAAGYSNESFELLLAAYKMNSENPATYSALALYGEFNNEPEQREQFARKLLSNNLVSPALLSYSYNVLMSVEVNSILFVDGDNTTLPLFILQDIMNVRKDVEILNLDLLTSQKYRDRKFSALALKSFVQKDSQGDFKKLICTVVPEQNPEKKFYYALTVGRENLTDITNQLYVVGLASQLSKSRIDNISVIKNNLETRFLMDYLLVDFNGESEYSAGRILSSNYLVPMLLLNDSYVKSGEMDKSMKLEKLFTKIANATGKSDLVERFLHREMDLLSPPASPLMDIGVKEVDGHLRLIKDNLYAYDEETTNKQYNMFLDYLKKNNMTDVLEKSKIDLSQYDATSLAFFTGYHTYINPEVKVRGKSNYHYKNYPIVNISHDGAIAYCNWLTEQYNGSADRKFKKVKFRLPTIKEWQIAAMGYVNFQSWNLDENKVKVVIAKDSTSELFKGDEKIVQVDKNILYPWFRSYNYRARAQNSRNCWLGNFKIPDDCKPCQITKFGGDGFSMMSPVGAYFPNDMGFYDVVGNVAEMTDEDGKACGGSWNQHPLESTIRSVSDYKGPGATIGFRVFMDVIEK